MKNRQKAGKFVTAIIKSLTEEDSMIKVLHKIFSPSYLGENMLKMYSLSLIVAILNAISCKKGKLLKK